MVYNYTPEGVCSRMISVTISDDGIIEKVQFMGGCNGNTQGVSRLCVGMSAEDAIERLRGIDCNGKGTSCPDQLSIALEQALNESFGS